MSDHSVRGAMRFLKFSAFSASAGLVQLASFTALLKGAEWAYWPSYLVALVLSVLYNFTVNRRFTFKSAANVPVAMLKVAGYYAVFTPLSTWWGDALTRAGWDDFIVLLGTMAINMTTEYLFCRYAVYRNAMDNRKTRDHAA